MPIHTEVVGLPRLRSNLTALEHRVFPRAAARALNRTATTVRANSIRAIAKDMGVKQRVVRDRTRIKRAHPNRLDQGAQVIFRGRRLNLIRFGARQTRRGVSATPWGKRRIFPQTFLVDLGTGLFVGIRKRVGGGQRHERVEDVQRTRRVGRTPIVGVVGPGVAETAAKPEHAAQRRKWVNELLGERMRRELAFYVARMAAR